jgi:hypothetical protein
VGEVQQASGPPPPRPSPGEPSATLHGASPHRVREVTQSAAFDHARPIGMYGAAVTDLNDTVSEPDQPAHAGAPLVDPSGRNWWDGQQWQPLPGRRRTRPPTWVLALVCVLVAAVIAGVAVVVAHRGSDNQSKAEDAFVSKMVKSKVVASYTARFTPAARRALINFGYQVCDDYSSGLSYKQILNKYQARFNRSAFRHAWVDHSGRLDTRGLAGACADLAHWHRGRCRATNALPRSGARALKVVEVDSRHCRGQGSQLRRR